MSDDKPVGKVFTALHAVMTEIGAIGKTNENTFQKYRFRSVAQAMAALQPLMVKHRLLALPQYRNEQLHPQEKGYTASVMLDLLFVHIDDESSVIVRVPGQGADSGDKGLAKALAMALKYAVFQTFMVPEEGVDAEFSEPEVKNTKNSRKSTPPAQFRDITG